MKMKKWEKCSKCYSLLYTIYRKTLKGQIKHKRKDQPQGELSISYFCFKNGLYTFKN